MTKKLTRPHLKSTGRPSKLHTIDQKQLKFLVNLGATEQQIANFFGFNRDSFSEWKKKNPSFSVTLKDWKDEADGKVERSLYQSALGYRTSVMKPIVVSDGKDAGSHVEYCKEEIAFAPNATSMIFWLKNRQPASWRDKIEVAPGNDLLKVMLGLLGTNGNGKHKVKANGKSKEHSFSGGMRIV